MVLPFTIDQMQCFMLILFRVSAIILSVPVFGTKEIPQIAKVGLALIIAWILVASLPVPAGLASISFLQLVPYMVAETMLGVVIGLVARMFFEGIQLGGQLIGFQMGFGIVNVMDPITGVNFSIIAQVKNLLAILIFISLGLHHVFLKVMFLSYDAVPLLQCSISKPLIEWMIQLSSDIFVLGVKVAAPAMIALLCISALMGIINKAAQGMNVMIVMFPMKIAVGLLCIALCMPMFLIVITKSFSNLDEYVLTILRFIRVAPVQ
jgi:flagellar biosynthesis protein FliR